MLYGSRKVASVPVPFAAVELFSTPGDRSYHTVGCDFTDQAVRNIGHIDISIRADSQVVGVFEFCIYPSSVDGTVRQVASGNKLHLAAGRKTAYSSATRLRNVKVSGIIEGQITGWSNAPEQRLPFLYSTLHAAS